MQRKKSILNIAEALLRLLRRFYFRFIRLFVYFCFRLWLKKVHNVDRLPRNGPAIIVSNHLSYYDWAILSAIYFDKYLVFIGNKDLLNRGFVGWLMKLNILIFIDPTNPGFRYFKDALTQLHNDRILVIYPEGTRSKTGKMLEPKTGFIKIAVKTGVPIIPLGMKGTFEILPPHKKVPRLRKCEVFVGEPVYVNNLNPIFYDLFNKTKNKIILTEDGEKNAAIRIMKIIKDMVNQEWDESCKF